jgi:hypothetical protein
MSCVEKRTLSERENEYIQKAINKAYWAFYHVHCEEWSNDWVDEMADGMIHRLFEISEKLKTFPRPDKCLACRKDDGCKAVRS